MNEKNSLLKWAMTYGLGLGIYWAIKYVFFIFGVRHPVFNIIYWILTLGVPFIAYYFTKQYKEEALGGEISFFHAWRYGTMLYFFAALIVSLVHFVFYQYIASPDFISQVYSQTIDLLKQSHIDTSMMETLSKIPVPSPIQMAIQGIFNNIFYGIVLSVPVAFIVSKRKTPHATNEKVNK